MSDFNWDDYENDDDELFNFGQNDDDGLSGSLERLHRMMFINDLEKMPSMIVPLDPIEFENMFGEATEEDYKILTQLLIKDIHKRRADFVIDKWGLSWIQDILKFNEGVEEYELCSIFQELIRTTKINESTLL